MNIFFVCFEIYINLLIKVSHLSQLRVERLKGMHSSAQNEGGGMDIGLYLTDNPLM